MSKIEKSAIFGLILIIIGALAFVSVSYQGRLITISNELVDKSEKIDSLEQENSSLKKSVEELEARNSEQAEQLDSLQKDSATFKNNLNANSKQLSTIGSNLSDLTDRVGEMSETLGALKARISKMPDDLASFTTVSEVNALKSSISKLEQRITGLTSEDVSLETTPMKVGYVNATEAFTVFTDAVSEERERAQKINEQVIALREKAIQGEVTEEEYKNQSVTLQAEKLKAQLAIDLAMIDKMIDAPGFTEVSDRLKQLKSQVDPIMNELDSVLENLRSGYAIPEDEETLSQIKDQYEQLDDLLTRLIESKIFQITNIRAGEKGYDLVLRQENVVLYRKGDRIDDLTDMTKQALREDMKT